MTWLPNREFNRCRSMLPKSRAVEKRKYTIDIAINTIIIIIYV